MLDLSSRKYDVVNRDKHELYNVADHSHDDEAHCACLKDLDILSVGWLLALIEKGDTVLLELSELLGNILLLLWSVSAFLVRHIKSLFICNNIVLD